MYPCGFATLGLLRAGGQTLLLFWAIATGTGMGIMPNAVANPQALVEQFRPAPRNFLVIPVKCFIAGHIQAGTGFSVLLFDYDSR